ncbi:phage tail assembly protein [Streptomyces halobius]|uniref:Phage tail assembly protein n=1 Tax=Streptomyces halobius TaxID=2879846 RepID=A0ABY4M530_9ACTN|nr:phage tail assembly protein [Streptomyces halobius]UQA92862.1 phage tail assembly protein [Streptomyces halobius]UQA94931.1 phage tail assembly protein [Streptomyces halobius]
MALSCAEMMAEAAAEYAGLDLETRAGKTVQLRNILMLPDEGLKAARVILGKFGETGAEELEELVPQIRDLLLLVADDPAALKTEMEDWPLAVFVRTVGDWQEETQVGEAPRSDS